MAVLAVLPWAAGWRAEAAPLLVVAALLTVPPWRLRPGLDPWAALLELASGAVAVAVWAGWLAAAAWSGLALLVASLAATPGHTYRRRQPAAVLALAGWGLGVALGPGQLGRPGIWLGAAVALAGGYRLGLSLAADLTRRRHPVLGPPTRELRGELVLDGLVGASPSGLPATRPVSLRLEPGQSAALVLDQVTAAAPLVEAICGRRAPAAGSVTVDGEVPGADDRLVAVIGVGEPLLPGGLEENLAALVDGPLPEGPALAAREACSLDEVEAALDRDDGEVAVLHRLLVQAARVTVSHYRIVVVVDPSPWVNTVFGEIWRRAVVRASVGRTALWITADRELARRADRLLAFRAGVVMEEEVE